MEPTVSELPLGEKRRIQAEVDAEQFRASLQPPPSRSQRMAKVVNSSLFLWFLSAVVVSGLTSVVSSHLQKEAQRIEQHSKLQRALFELGARWQKLRKLTNLSSPGESFFMSTQEREYTDILFAQPSKWTTGPIIVDFKEHSLLSLTYEIELFHLEESCKAAVRELRNELLNLEGQFKRKIEGDPDRADRLFKATSRFESHWSKVLSLLRYQGTTLVDEGKYIPDFEPNRKCPIQSASPG